jgi:hypothetical protein
MRVLSLSEDVCRRAPAPLENAGSVASMMPRNHQPITNACRRIAGCRVFAKGIAPVPWPPTASSVGDMDAVPS